MSGEVGKTPSAEAVELCSTGRTNAPVPTYASSEIVIEPERYELSAGAPYRFDLGRREFFKFLGAGVVVVSVLNTAVAVQESGSARGRHEESLPKEIDAWLHIGEDGQVTVYTGKAEMGQNIRTSLTQAVAEELRGDGKD
jgi:isoquinoline 1-oxidoreductase